MRARITALVLGLTFLAAGAPPAMADCPGASGACPYTSGSQIGQRGGGVLRFPQAIAVGPDGSVYVGDQGSHVVQVFSPEGAFLREVGQAGSRPGELRSVGGLAVAADNTLFVAGGTNRIDRFDATGRLVDHWGSTGAGAGQFRFGAGGGNDAAAGGGLAIGGGDIYVADTGNDRVQRFTLDGGRGVVIVPPGQLANPRGLAVRGTRLVVADDQHHRLVVYDTGGHFLRTVGAGPGPEPGQLQFPYDVALDAQGRLFVADDLNHRVVRFSTAPSYPYTARWGFYGSGEGGLAYPRGIAVDQQGRVYVANTGNDRIDVFDRGGALLRSFGTSGRGAGQFDRPTGVAADASGIRAVTDSINGRVQFLNPDGSLASSWGSPAPGPTILRDPVAVAFDASANAYVLDRRRSRIVVFDRATGLPTRTIGARGVGPGRLLDPSALAIDGAGKISVADTGSKRIARFTTSGAYLGAITGTGAGRGIAVTPDGSRIYLASSANRITAYSPGGVELDHFGGTGAKLGKLNAPGQMTLDGAGNLWVAERGNNRVQEFGPNGERLQTFGRRGTGAGEFIHPTGVTIDCHGALTVTDSDNDRVQQFALAAPAAPACAALSPLGTPPPPRLPVLPAPLGPQVRTSVLRQRDLLSKRTLPVRLGCDTPCSIVAGATVTQRARPKRGHRAVSVTLHDRHLKLAGGETRIIRLRVSTAGSRRLKRALHGRRGLTVSLRVSATASAGESTSVTKRLRATR